MPTCRCQCKASLNPSVATMADRAVSSEKVEGRGGSCAWCTVRPAVLVQKVLRREFDHLVALVWIPGHARIPRNECARAVVWELTNQAINVTSGMPIHLEPDFPERRSNHHTTKWHRATSGQQQRIDTCDTSALVDMHSRVFLLAETPFQLLQLCSYNSTLRC